MTSKLIHTKLQWITFISYFLLLSLLTDTTHSLEQQLKATSNPNGAPDSRDINSDSSDTNYDHGGVDDTREEEPGEGSLPSPTDLNVIRMNDTAVVLRWEFEERFQDRLQFFKIQYASTKKDSVWTTDSREIPVTTRAFQINRLKPGNYFFRVIAVYDNDDNVSSEQYKYRLRAKSKIPADELPDIKAPVIHWQEAKPDYFRFKWRYDARTRDLPWLGYLVYYRSAHTVSDFTIHATLDENVEIVDVEPDTPYEAKVVAYNLNGTSEFSETVTIKTEARPNSTTEATPISTTTPSPTIVESDGPSSTTKRPITQEMIEQYYKTTTPTERPSLVNQPTTTTTTNRPTIIDGPTSSSNSSSLQQCFMSVIECFKGGQNDAMSVIKPLSLVLLPVMLIAFVVICLLSRHRGNHKDSPPSSTNESMQFDLEINGYFKNSFPGVDKNYPGMTAENVNAGFLSNHPHIHDFA